MFEQGTSTLSRAFDAVKGESLDGEGYADMPCFVNGEPATAIVRLHRQGTRLDGEVLWVSVTPGMVIVDPRGRRAA
jgi:hypothetical protein